MTRCFELLDSLLGDIESENISYTSRGVRCEVEYFGKIYVLTVRPIDKNLNTMNTSKEK